MFPLALQLYMDTVVKEMKKGMGRRGMRFLDERREWRLPDLILCGESKEDFRAMVGRFVEVCRKRCLKVNILKSRLMVLNERRD